MISLKNKTALVTGGTSGIGLGIATTFAKNHANLLIFGIEPIGQVTKILEDLSSFGEGAVTYHQLDMSDLDVMSRVDSIFQEYHVDILVNNAGMQFVSPVEQFPLDKYHKVMNLNLHAPFILIQKALPSMRKKGWGRIINIASTHGLVASANKSAYCASKHGLLGLTKVVALETALENITCNAICPGWVLTPLVEAQIHARAAANGTTFDEEKYKLLSEKQPTPEFTKPEDIGEMCLFLCSDAARQMRGGQVVIDGGWTIQ